jgi:ribose transport system substrate-binding protein
VKRKILLQLVLPLLGLILLFSLLAFAPGRSQREPVLLEMSVILREADSSHIATTRQGMEQAAADLNVELRFLTPASDNNPQEQLQLLTREVEAGASAIVLIPADRALLDPAAADAGKASLVTLETEMDSAQRYIGVDNAALGQALGQAALNGVPSGGAVLLMDSAPGDNGIRERLEAAAAVLEAEGREVLICRRTNDLSADLQSALAQAAADAVVAFEPSALETAVELAWSEGPFPLLYGAGSTPLIAAGLEQNAVTAILAQNEFTAGYLAVQSAAELARRQSPAHLEPLPFTLLRQETMYLPENQKLLFPVT